MSGASDVVEHGEERSPRFRRRCSQARQAARDGVGIDIVLRRCLAANTAFVESLIDEGEDLPEGDLFQALRAQTAAFERLTAAAIDEHTRAAAIVANQL